MTYAVDMSVTPEVQAFFDEATNTISYIVKDPTSNSCALIDTVMDIDYAAGRITFDHADELIRQIKAQDLKLEWIIETHVHADHLSAAPYIQQKLGGKIGVGSKITVVQDTFGKVFNEGTEFQRDGSQFDALFEDGDTYMVGNMQAFAMYTPGHTPACMVHVMGDAAFVGDTLFMPDGGSARCDFPGGSAEELYDSIQKVLALPDELACSCATTTAQMAALLRGKPPWPNRKKRTFMWAKARRRKTSSSSAPSVTPNWPCQN